MYQTSNNDTSYYKWIMRSTSAVNCAGKVLLIRYEMYFILLTHQPSSV